MLSSEVTSVQSTHTGLIVQSETDLLNSHVDPSATLGMTVWEYILHSSSSKRFVVISWVLVVVWAAFIFFMSSRTDSGLSEGGSILSLIYQGIMQFQEQIFGVGVDVASPVAHFCEYVVFGILLANALRLHMPIRRACIIALVAGSLYGITDEFHQLFVPGRMCDPVDWLVDTAGATIGAVLAFLVLRKRQPKIKR